MYVYRMYLYNGIYLKIKQLAYCRAMYVHK
jgi:hypothetical protein